ncbi:MAG: ATP-binding protein [Bacteroidales bacterium]
MHEIRQKFYNKISEAGLEPIRDFANTIDWKNRFIGIKGSRGVGKTTLILQHLKQQYESFENVLYVSLDDLYFTENRLYDLVSEFYVKGGRFLALDEVHRYKSWAIELKNIYDDFSELKLVFTGSSLLHLQKAKADLSRRAVIYQMPGLSFREYLNFERVYEFERYGLNDILNHHVEIAMQVKEHIRPIEYFSDYLSHGYYPFYLENKQSFHRKLEEILLTILEVDIPQYINMPSANIYYIKKLLQIISNSVPFKPNMTSLSERTGISLNTLKQYLYLMHEAEVVTLLRSPSKGINSLNKPEKIYIDNPNMMYALSNQQPDKGNIRETFFMNQVKQQHHVTASKDVDFIVDGKHYFEFGGRSKNKKQIRNLDDSWILKDDIEIGSGNVIPLWMFGFLY